MGWIGAATGARFATISPPAPPPSEDPDFGPAGTGTLAQRVQAVKNSTIPQAVVHPGGSPTVVNPGDNIATKITTAGTNGTLWFLKGLHTVTTVLVPLAGQTWVLESNAGYARDVSGSAVLDGNDAATSALIWGQSPAPNVTIRGGVFQNQGNASSPLYTATIHHNGGPSAGGWLIQDAVVQNNFFRAIRFTAPNNTIRRCYMTNNGQYGPVITADDVDPSGNIVENCRWSFNNSRLLDTGFDAGGSKFLHSPGLIIRNNWVHDNHGFAIWADFVGTVGGDVSMENNVVEHNRRSGLFMEGIQGGCRMFRNYCINNGYDLASIGGNAATQTNCVQARITNSDSTKGSGIRGDVSRNVFDFNLTQDNVRGKHFYLWNHDPIDDDCRNWDIHLNQFWFRSLNDQRVGGFDNKVNTPGIQVWDGDNDFFDNEYRVADTGTAYWKWDTGEGQGIAKTYSQWRGFHPGEPTTLQGLT